jgi:hypothetical protein
MSITTGQPVKFLNVLSVTRKSEKVLSLNGDEANEGTQLILWDDLGQLNQQWQLTFAAATQDGDYYTIRPVKSSTRVVEVVNAAKGYPKGQGAEIVLRTYPTAAEEQAKAHNMHWKLLPVEGKNSVYKIENRNSGFVLDAEDAKIENGRVVKQWAPWKDDGRQQWRLMLA